MGLKKIFVLLLILCSINSIGQLVQFPTTYGVGYQRTGGDTLLWIPNDTIRPISQLIGRTHLARKGTTVYYWNGSAWTAVGVTYTAGSPIRLAGTVFSVDTSRALAPSLATNARLQEIIDSLNAIGWNKNIYNSDGTLTGTRAVTLNGNTLTLNGSGSNTFQFAPTQATWDVFNSGSKDYHFIFGGGSIQLYHIPTGVGASNLLRLQSSYAELNSQHTSGSESFIRVYPDSIRIAAQDGFVTMPSLQNDVGTKAIRYNPSTGKITYADTTGGGSGTVTSVASGYGTNFSTITGTGSVVIDTTSGGVASWQLPYKIRDSLNSAGWNNNISNSNLTQSASHSYDLGGFTQTITNGKFKADSVNLPQVALPGIADSLLSLGNSITAGQGASTTDSAYIVRYKTSLGLVLDDRSVSGRGIWQSATNGNTYINPGHTKVMTLMAGFNDMRRGGNSQKTYSKVINGTKNLIMNQFLKVYYAAGATVTGLTRNGSWSTGYLSNTVSGKTTNGAFTNTNNDSLTYVFTDSTIALGLIYGDGSAEVMTTSVQIYIDGALQTTLNLNNGSDGISDGANSNDRIAGGWFRVGMPYAQHRLSVINKTATRLAVDYVGHFALRNDMYPVVVFHAPHMDATGYATSPNNASDGSMDSLNTKLDSLKSSLPTWWPVYVARTNDYYIATTASGLSSADHIHPNDTGHRQIWQSGTAVLSDVNFLPVYGTVITKSGGRLTYIDSAHHERSVAFVDQLSSISDPISITPTANQVHLTTKNFSTQTADGYQHLANDGTVKFKVDNGGGLQILGGINNLITSASSLEIEQPSANTSYITQLNRGSGTYGTLNMRFGTLNFTANGTIKSSFNTSGRLFLGGSTSATALLHLGAGTATASTAPLKFTQGTILTTPESGVLETNSSNELYYSTSTTVPTRGFVALGRYDSTATGITLGANNSTIGVTATGQTITLPTAAGIQGRIYTIKLTASGSCTIATTSSQLIDGATTYSLASQYKYVTVQSTGANWVIIANN